MLNAGPMIRGHGIARLAREIALKLLYVICFQCHARCSAICALSVEAVQEARVDQAEDCDVTQGKVRHCIGAGKLSCDSLRLFETVIRQAKRLSQTLMIVLMDYCCPFSDNEHPKHPETAFRICQIGQVALARLQAKDLREGDGLLKPDPGYVSLSQHVP